MKRIVALLLSGLVLAAVAGRAADDLSRLSLAETNHVPRLPGPDDRLISRLVATLLEKSHYIQAPITPDISSKFFDRYLDAFDPQHIMFLESDVEEFSKYRRTLGDLTKRMGDSLPAEIVFARYLDRLTQQTIYVTNLLATEKFEFTGDERFTLNRKDAPRPKNLAEAQKLWRERLRWEYLDQLLAKKKPEEIQKTILRRYARTLRTISELDTDEVLQVYLSAFAHVYDPHSEYMGKPTYENFNINMKLALFGIGATLQLEDGYCTIKGLSPGGPAERSGKIKVNDKIILVAQGTNEPVDVVDMKLTKAVEMIRGAKGTEVRLTIIPADAPDSTTTKVVALIRDEIKLEDAEAKAKLFELPAVNGKPAVRLGVIDLPSFYADMGNRAADHKSTTTDVAKLIRKLLEEKVTGIILDLRRNGGGSLEEAIKLTGIFIKDGPVVQVKDPDGTVTVDKDNDPSVVYDGPLVVLTSRFSASASEIFAGAMQDYGRALVVGDSSTHGKGTVQTVQELNRFVRNNTNQLGALKFTIRKFYRASGSSTQLKGVVPDIVLPSINNHAEVGEGSLPGALSWDTVPPAKYEPVNLVNGHAAELRKRSEARTATDKDFAWLKTEAARFEKMKNDKTVSLNEAQRRKEKKEAEDRVEARKKELKARPQPDYKFYELTLKLAAQPGLPPPGARTNQTASVTKEKPPKPANPDDDSADDAEDETVPAVDIHLDEARRILLDLIELSGKEKVVVSSAGK